MSFSSFQHTYTHHIKVYTIHLTSFRMLALTTWTRHYLSDFSTVKLLSFSFFLLFSLEGNHCAQPHGRSGVLIHRQSRICDTVLGILHVKLAIPPHLLIHSITYLFKYRLRYFFYTQTKNGLLMQPGLHQTLASERICNTSLDKQRLF